MAGLRFIPPPGTLRLPATASIMRPSKSLTISTTSINYLPTTLRLLVHSGRSYRIAEKIPAGERYPTSVSVAGTLARRGICDEAIEAVLLAINEHQADPPKSESRDAERHQQDSVVHTEVEAMTPPWVLNLQRNASGQMPNAPDLTVQSLSDHGNGQRLIDMFGGLLRWCPQFKTWAAYTGTHWQIDDSGVARALTQQVMVAASEQLIRSGNKATVRFARTCLNSARITNAMQEAAPHLTLTIEQMDQHHHLLNFLNFTVDLRTGATRTHRREDYITKVVPFPFNPSAKCPLLDAFLKKMLPGQELSVQRRIGYSFTGLVHEKTSFLCFGPNGNNGKTCLLHTIYRILGKDYAAVLPIEALTDQHHNSNNVMDALAALRGARFVRVTEADEGQRISEAQLKRICQGMDAPIQAGRKFEHVITFPETHKIWLDCNHLPVIRGTDNAIWDRLQVVPFNVTLAADEIDHELPAKLLEEAEGILAFGVAGAVEWFQRGLDRPATMRDAQDQWRQDSDQIGRFIADCCVVGSFAQAKVNPLYQTYRKWAEEGGEKNVLSHHDFGRSIISRGFTKGQNSAGFFYRGIGIATSQTPPP